MSDKTKFPVFECTGPEKHRCIYEGHDPLDCSRCTGTMKLVGTAFLRPGETIQHAKLRALTTKFPLVN